MNGRHHSKDLIPTVKDICRLIPRTIFYLVLFWAFRRVGVPL